MAAAFKFALQKGIHDSKREADADYAFAQAEHVSVIMPPRGAGEKFIGAYCGPYASKAVGHHGHAESCAADEDAEIAVCQYRLAQRLRIYWVVAALDAVGAMVLYGVTLCCKVFNQSAFQGNSGMIRCEVDGLQHERSLLYI